MQAETALTRVGFWFLVMLAMIVIAAGTTTPGFAIQAAMIGALAVAMMFVTASRFDPLGSARGFFRMPEGTSRYDDDTVRWGAIATTF